jgi:hypothetical protein
VIVSRKIPFAGFGSDFLQVFCRQGCHAEIHSTKTSRTIKIDKNMFKCDEHFIQIVNMDTKGSANRASDQDVVEETPN